MLGIIQQLVDSNANLNNFVENERSRNSKLTGEILDLRLQIQKLSADVCLQGPNLKVSTNTQTEENMNQNSGIDSVQRRFAKQLKEVQKLKHEEFVIKNSHD